MKDTNEQPQVSAAVPQFSTSSFGGYKKDEVDTYITQIREKHAKEINKCRDSIEELRVQLRTASVAEKPEDKKHAVELENELRYAENEIGRLQDKLQKKKDKVIDLEGEVTDLRQKNRALEMKIDAIHDAHRQEEKDLETYKLLITDIARIEMEAQARAKKIVAEAEAKASVLMTKAKDGTKDLVNAAKAETDKAFLELEQERKKMEENGSRMGIAVKENAVDICKQLDAIKTLIEALSADTEKNMEKQGQMKLSSDTYRTRFDDLLKSLETENKENKAVEEKKPEVLKEEMKEPTRSTSGYVPLKNRKDEPANGAEIVDLDNIPE